jgi:hypothetical protein
MRSSPTRKKVLTAYEGAETRGFSTRPGAKIVVSTNERSQTTQMD